MLIFAKRAKDPVRILNESVGIWGGRFLADPIIAKIEESGGPKLLNQT
jgi:hypothetical protein